VIAVLLSMPFGCGGGSRQRRNHARRWRRGPDHCSFWRWVHHSRRR